MLVRLTFKSKFWLFVRKILQIVGILPLPQDKWQVLNDEQHVEPSPAIRNRWYYPTDIAHDLDDLPISEEMKGEVFACAWEYTRCVIPQYTNWPRYVAFMRIISMGIIAEFKGTLVDVSAGDDILGYDLGQVLDDLFSGTTYGKAMAQEFKAFLLISADKASHRRSGELFRRYVNAAAHSPRQWFRMRDADALARFTIYSALACNDMNNVNLTEAELEILTEVGDTLYDAVAFYKHRSEGETNSTFAYVPSEIRLQAFHDARELLWALDVALAARPEGTCIINFVRFFGGPIHMMMRRYRFVEEGLTVGRPETDDVIKATRQNFKLWNRVDTSGEVQARGVERYNALLSRSEELMYDGLAEFLQNEKQCPDCRFRESYGAESRHRFGGVELCSACKTDWAAYVQSLTQRANKVFPELADVDAFRPVAVKAR